MSALQNKDKQPSHPTNERPTCEALAEREEAIMSEQQLIEAIITRFNEIKESSFPQTIKNFRFAELMTEMEHYFNIPYLRDLNYERAHQDVMECYLMLSKARID